MKPITTLFMLESLDGKISTGNNDNFDIDKDFIKIDGVKEGLNQYYEIEATTDLYSLNTGRVMKKIGVNERNDNPSKTPCSFIIIDNKPHLEISGIDYLSKWVNKLYLVTTNKNHPVFDIKDKYSNIEIMYYENLNLNVLLNDLYNKGIDKLTIQSGGNLNNLFLRNDLIDYVHIVIAPILIGGSDVSTLIDGDSIKDINELSALELISVNILNNSYIELKYEVIHKKR